MEDLDGEDEILVADELELSAYLDAVAKAGNEPSSDSVEPPDGMDGAGVLPEEDEEDSVIKVITKGLCTYCG